MKLSAALNDFRSLPIQGWREGAHVLFGTARAAALAAHNALTFGSLFGDKAIGPLTEEEDREFRQRIIALFDADWRNVEAGVYPTSLTRDFSWRRLARLYPRLALDALRMRQRIRAERHDDLPASAAEYPAYYRRNFHFQTDGYFSRESAALYDAQVELLFAGTASAMRRQVLPPIVRALHGRNRSELKILDVACGPGEMLRMLSAVLTGAHVFGLDLSPAYIAHAREALRDVTPLSLVIENAEKMPFVDGYFHALSCVYLMHELPPHARDRVLREIGRVLVPGGIFVLADSIQPADVPAATRHLEHFPQQFHEPFYRHYLHDDLTARIRRAQLEVLDVQIHFLTKVVVARRPV